MVKYLRSAIIILLFVALFSFPAEGVEYCAEYKNFTDNIPDDIKGLLPGEILSENEDDISCGAEKMMSPKYIWGLISDYLGFYMGDMLHLLARLLGLILISAIAHSIFDGNGDEALREQFSLCTSSAFALAVIYEQWNATEMVRNFLDRLLTLVNSMIPLMGVLYAAGGNTYAASSGTASLGFFLAICENLLCKALMPVVGICLAFSLCSAFSKRFSGSELSSCFKRTYTFGMGLIVAIMSLVMGVQNQLASKADSLGARAAKYAISSFIPIVGSSVGDSYRTVAASIEYIRGCTGGIAILVILILLLPTLISLILGRTVLGIGTSVSKMLGCEREGAFLAEISNIYGYLLAVCSMCSVIFIYALTLFVRCGAAIGG